MTEKEALKLALEFVEANHFGGPDTFDLITAIKEALAQPAVPQGHEQSTTCGEPVAHFGSAYVNENGVHVTTVLGPVAIPQDAKLYTTPPQPKELEQEPWLLETTQTLAKHMAREFYPEVTQWECLDNLAGVISQIDNMTTGLMRKPEQEPVAWPIETNNQVEALAKRCGWDNRRYMTPEDYQIWCDRMRQFVQLATPPQPKEPEQKPVAWIEHHKGGDNLNFEEVNHPYAKATPLYTSPPQRKPLTLVELSHIFASIPSVPFDGKWQLELARSIEAAHGIKGLA